MTEGRRLTDKELEKLERRLAKEYRTAKKDMQKKLDKFVKKFSAADKAQKGLLDKGAITKKQYKEWRDGQIARSQWMQEQIKSYADDLVNVNRRAAEMINMSLPKVFNESHLYGLYEAEKATDFHAKLYNRDAVARLLKDSPQLLPKASIDIPKDKRWNVQKMNSALTQGLMQGESIDKIATRLQNVTDMDRASAIRNARTMVTGAENAGKLESYRRAAAMGIKIKKTWSATMDDRTRDSHAFLDGVTVELEEEFPNGLMYPGDPGGSGDEVWNCRCELSMQMDGFERDMTDLSERNTDHLYYDSYQEWKTRRVSVKEIGFNPTTVKRFVSGDMPYKAAMADNALRAYEISDIPVFFEKMEPLGETMTSFKGKLARVESVKLNRLDPRGLEYQQKTAFHEAFHASINGKRHDRGILKEKYWKAMDETMAETSAHYLMKTTANITDLAPNYASALYVTLPRLKQLQEFKGCSTLADFGERAYNLRRNGGDGVWKPLFDKMIKQPVSSSYYAQYIPLISKDIDGIIAKMAENQPSMRILYNNRVLRTSINKLQKGQALSDYQEKVFKNACVIVMNRAGVF